MRAAARRFRHAALLLFSVSIGCAQTTQTTIAKSLCAAGSHSDAARQARITQLCATDPAAADLLRTESVQICFGDGFGSGVIAQDIAYLDAQKSDRELAPRLLHLLVHHRDKLGDGCRKGLAAARASEAQAREIERAMQQRLGLSTDAVSPFAESDYLRRCAD